MLRLLNRVFTRILVLAVLALGALAALGLFVMNESRTNLYEQKKADTRHVVEAVATILTGYDKRVAAGELTRDQAQAEARKVITALRYEGNEYVFVNDFNGISVIHPTKPENVGQNLINRKDPSGKFYVQEFVKVAKAGGGFVSYGFQPPGKTEFVDKISYVQGFQPWQWMVGTGVLIDDVEAMYRRMVKSCS